MKKKYQSPKVYIESFELSQTIASGGCGAAHNSHFGGPTHWSKATCGWSDPSYTGMTVFVERHVCTLEVNENTDYNGICYNAPSAGNSIFGS